MATMCIHLISAVILFGIGNAKTDFPSLHCKAENLGQYGQQSLLECVIENPKEDTRILVVSWKKGNRALLVFRNGEIKDQKDGFFFAQPSWNDRNMNVSLLITNTGAEHHGTYTCDVMTDDNPPPDVLIKICLTVTAKYSKPTIVSSPTAITPNTDGTLTCESNGGFPKGQLRWFNERNEELTSDDQMKATQADSGLFQLSSQLVVEKESSLSKYTCRVFNASGGQEEENLFEVLHAPKAAGRREELDTATKIVAPVVVIGSLIAGLLFALLVYRRRSQNIRRHSTIPLMRGHVGVPTSDEERMEEVDDKYPDNEA